MMEPNKVRIFVFGSNLAGKHGKGAALDAVRDHGAVMGKGTGHHGNSYGIATKDKKLHVLSLGKIKAQVDRFIEYAKDNPQWEFQVTQVGCGHAGFPASDMAPMYENAPDNCFFDTAWSKFLPGKNFWGTYEAKPMISRVRVMDDEEYENG